MRTGAIFARGSCRALKWMALFGVVFALGGGEALAQTATGATTHTEANNYSDTIVVLEFDQPVWGNVPAGAFTVGTNTADAVMGLPMGSPGSAMFSVSFVNPITVTGGGQTIDYTPPTADGRTLLTADGSDSGTEPDDVAAFSGNGVQIDEEENDPILPDIAPVTIDGFTMSDLADPAGELPSVVGASGADPIMYMATPAAPFGLTIETSTGLNLGKIHGTPTGIGTLQVTWTATDSQATAVVVTKTFQLSVRGAPAKPAAPTVATAASGALAVSWNAPLANGSAITHYQVQYRSGTSVFLPGAPLAVSEGTMTTLTGLTNGTEYDVGVRALNGIGWSPYSDSGQGTPTAATAVAVPGLPMGLMATAGPGHVTLSWGAPTDGGAPTGYQYQYGTSTSTMSAWMPAVPQTEMMAMVTGLTNGTSYLFNVRAVNATGPGAATASVTATPSTTPPTTTLTAKTSLEVAAAFATALATAAGSDGEWNVGDPAVTIPLSALFNGVPTSVTVTVSSSAPGFVTATAPASGGVVLTAVSNGSSTVTVTVNTVSTAPYTVTVGSSATPPTTIGGTDGIITAVVVKDAPARTIGGVERVHVTEGDLTEVLVTVQWTHAQVTALWGTEHTPASPPEPAMVQLMVVAETNAVWLSLAETDEDPGPGSQAGYDAVLASGALGRRVSIAIPTKPKATEEPMSTSRFLSKTGSISLSLPHDTDAEDEGFRINVVEGTGVFVSTSDSRSRKSTLRAIVIEDDETQGIVLSRNPASTAAIFEGGKAPFKAIADPPREDLELQVRYNVTTLEGVSVSSREYTLDSSIGVIPVGIDSDANPARDLVTFSSPKNDGNRTDDDFRILAEVVSFDLGSGAFDDIGTSTVDITVLDLHRLPTLTVSPEESTVEEGESVELTLTLDRDPARDRARRTGGEKNDVTSEPVTVMLTMGAGTTADMDDYRLPRTVTFPKHDGKAPWTQDAMVEVMALDDTELDEMEMLVLDAMIAGTVVANGTEKETVESVAMLTIEEGTTNLVWAKTEEDVYAVLNAAKADGVGADMTFNPGEMIEVMASAMFNNAEGVTLSFTADSDDEDVASTSVSSGMVMVTAEDMAGMAHITVTAHASMPSGVMIVDQTDPREASILFPVEVGLEALTIMLSGPDDMNVAEGMSAMVTATANRAVTEGVTVTLMRDRSMSTADDMDFTAEPIMIEAGEMMGSTMVMAVEDDMAEEMEELVLYGMAADNAGEVTGEVTLYLWDAAVPALPLIAQLLLGALLGFGGYRRYLRRR